MEVARVDADAHAPAVRQRDGVADRGQLLEPPSEAGALARSGLDEEAHLPGRALERVRHALGDHPDALLLVGVAAGMEDEPADPEQVAALQLVGEGGPALLADGARPAQQRFTR